MGTECHYFICDVGNREEVYRQAKAVREKVSECGNTGFGQNLGKFDEDGWMTIQIVLYKVQLPVLSDPEWLQGLQARM